MGEGTGGWTFLTNHGHILLLISRDPDIRVRELAGRVGITERAAHRIVADLVGAGYLSRTRVGRRNAMWYILSCPCVTPSSARTTSGNSSMYSVAQQDRLTLAGLAALAC